MFYCLLWFIHPISVKRPIFPLFKLYLILPILLFKFTKFQFTRLQAISVPDFSWRLKVTPAKSVFYFDLEGSVARQPPFFVRASYVIPTFRGYLLPLKHRERFATLNPIANKPARVTVTQTCYRGWLGVRSCGDCVNPMRGGAHKSTYWYTYMYCAIHRWTRSCSIKEHEPKSNKQYSCPCPCHEGV